MADARKVVVVGGGQAGGWAAVTLRREGHQGPIILLGEEPHPPHERPPLSKQVLKGDAPVESVHLHPEDLYQELDIELRLGQRVAALDRAAGRLRLEDGNEVPYDVLVLATGARPRELPIPGGEAAPIRYLRSIDDSLAIKAAVRPESRVMVIGGGLIGLEVAASAAQLGAAVSVLEAAPRLMARVVAPAVSDFFAELHRGQGVEIALGVTAQRIEPGEDGACRVICSDGKTRVADLIVIGIGVVPNSELAEAAGLAVDNGVTVDAQGRTSDPRIFAAGDVTNHHNPLLDRQLRLESWQNAQNQAIHVAKVICGAESSYAELPWFWTDQFDINLQGLGLPEDWDEVVLRGNREAKSFSLFYLKDGRIEGVNAVNAPKDIAISRRLMAQGKRVDPARLKDLSQNLRALLKG